MYFKDTLYYDAILEDLKNDAKCQAQCMIRATQLGQLAMEYLDDRQSEFKELEETVKRDMKQRLEDLNGVSRAMEKIQGTMKLLIRKDVIYKHYLKNKYKSNILSFLRSITIFIYYLIIDNSNLV